ncbi:MAG TPA: hypothetical protein VIA62_24245 [Thermoanaerobaculia bacterium]|jgi:hypothetical protein|nr:hypothetical protein [Thermoanaerobaculia bacterium]
MPTKLQVPERHAGALAEFVRLPPETLSLFLRLLREEQPTLDIGDLISTVAAQTSLDRGQVSDIFQMLSSLYATRENLGMDVGEFVAEVRTAIEESGKVEPQPADWKSLEEAFRHALAADTALSISAKAVGVLTDHPHVYWYSRILTDLRPVFRTDLGERPPAMVVVHNLKIAYRTASEYREFFVALDTLDVQALRDILDRALEKEKSLRTMAEKSNLCLLEVKS